MVSVIIPIYNVKHFIKRGLHNVLQQIYQDFEIILSDDGSTDGSYEECQKWAKQDSRIRVLHQENKGAGAARNHGIEVAKGEFIYFFDIDDEISPRLLDYCIGKMNEFNVDFICFGYDNVETTYRNNTKVTFPETIIHSNNELRDIFIDEFVLKTNGFPWNKFYRKSFLDSHNLRYEDQRIQQDEVFNLKCYHHLSHAYLSPEILYTYYVYEKGNTRSRFIPDRFGIYKSVRKHFIELEDFWNLNDQRLEGYLDERFYNSVLQCMLFNITHAKCPWNRELKKKEMSRIMTDPLTIQSFKWAESNVKSFEQALYRKACKNQSIFQISLYTSIFKILRKIKRILN